MPLKLISATPSAYARINRIAMMEKGVEFELRNEVPWNLDTETPTYNPLEKLPILILEDGSWIYDSELIQVSECLEGHTTSSFGCCWLGGYLRNRDRMFESWYLLDRRRPKTCFKTLPLADSHSAKSLGIHYPEICRQRPVFASRRVRCHFQG